MPQFMPRSPRRSVCHTSTAAGSPLAAAAATALFVLAAAPATAAQHVHNASPVSDTTHRSRAESDGMQRVMTGPLGIPYSRMGSGTSWVPDSTPMHADHLRWGAWTAMIHGAVFGQYDYQGSRRGASQ